MLEAIADCFAATARVQLDVLLVVRRRDVPSFGFVPHDAEVTPQQEFTAVAARRCRRGERFDVVVPELLAAASLPCDSEVRQLPADGLRYVTLTPTHVGECLQQQRCTTSCFHGLGAVGTVARLRHVCSHFCVVILIAIFDGVEHILFAEV